MSLRSGARLSGKVRIEDVADVAGVSMKTVSRVLNHEPNVREETRARVEAAVAQLQYRPNPSARSLAGLRSYVVALVYDNPSRNYLMQIQAGLLPACRANNYNLALAPAVRGETSGLAELQALIAHSGCDGVVVVPPLTDDPVMIAFLDEVQVPYVCISPSNPQGRASVSVDEHAMVVDLIGHLVSLGHRRIAHVKGHPLHGACIWRWDGYREALQRAGIDYDDALVCEGDFTFEAGHRAAQQLLSLPTPPTAIFAANDDMAAGVLRAALERGLRVPHDLSICGFDDTMIASHVYPSLTTVHQPTSELGVAAMQLLLQEMRQPRSAGQIRLHCALRLRESVAPPAES
ncbi:MAG TPA: LacI family DNA-binding transcriptional regulator [Aquimonas sp.]|nr:LacI family DNA-binding transcriptional regulator [Aquimonas sp.]